MHILVLGGGGGMGRITVRALTEYAEVTTITLADYSEERASEVASSLASANVQVQQIDVNDEGRLRMLVRQSDVVLNAVDYIYNMPVLRACIAERVHYADLGGLFHVSRQMLALHEEARSAGIIALAGMGGTPGITNLLARLSIDELERVESIRVQLGCSDSTPSTAPLVAPYSLRTILDEFTRQPQVFQDGKWYAQQPLSGQEELLFPDPVGRATAVYSLHSECATFPVSFVERGLRYVSFKIAFPGDFMRKLKFLVDLGLGSEEPLTVRGTQVVPRDVLTSLLERFPSEPTEPQDCDVLRVVTIGRAGGQRLEITKQVQVFPYRRWGVGAGALDTGVPLAIAGLLLARGEIHERGVMGPELCVPTSAFFRELAKFDMHVESSTRVLEVHENVL